MNKYEQIYNKIIKDIKSGKRVSPLRAIRAKCLDCVCYSASEVSKCPIPDCPLYKFRGGRNTTGKKRVMSEKQKENAKKLGELSGQRKR